MDILTCPLKGIEDVWPAELYVIHQFESGRFGVYCFQGVYGVAAFSTTSNARAFIEQIDDSGMEVIHVDFETAREIAKQRPHPVVSLMLLDDIQKPVIHYVR